MKRKSSLAAAGIALAGMLAVLTGCPAERAGARPDSLLVKLRPGCAVESLDLARFGDVSVQRVTRGSAVPALDGLFVLRVPEAVGSSLLDSLVHHPAVAYAEPDAPVHAAAIPDDPRFGELWGLQNLGQTGGTPDADIDAPEAWDLQTGDPSVVVAVLDTGIDYRHEDLADNVWTNAGEIADNGIDDDANGYVDDVIGWDFFHDDNDPFDDGSGHGTHVSGIIAAVANNSVGIVGVSPDVRIMPLKFQSSGQVGTVAGAIAAIDYAIRMGADVLSNSWAVSQAWGEPGFDQPGFSQALSDAIQAAGDAGLLFVATAGNSGENKDVIPIFPASYPHPNVIAVGATDADDHLPSWSNFGLGTVELAAPGVSILSTVPASCFLRGTPPEGSSACDGSGYKFASGTSMATPHVAAVVALIRAEYPSLSLPEVKARLLFGTDPLPDLVGVTVSEGRLNARRSLERDDVSPGPIPDLVVEAEGPSWITLGWTAPGDDAAVGSARAYEVRSSTLPVDDSNFDQATRVSGAPWPGGAGSQERMVVGGLEPSTTRYFALRAVDNVGNRGPVSNAAAATTTAPTSLPGLVAHWAFDEGAGQLAGDSSGNGNIAGLVGQPSWIVGRFGGAIELGGEGEYAAIGDAVLAPGFPGKAGAASGDFTVAAWVRTGLARYQMIAAKDAQGARSFNLAVRDDGSLEAQLYTPDFHRVETSARIQAGEWTHVGLVHERGRGELRLYLNGSPAASTPGAVDPVVASDAEFRLGARAFAVSQSPLAGGIDDVAVFERALSDAEMAALPLRALPEAGTAFLAAALVMLAALRATKWASR